MCHRHLGQNGQNSNRPHQRRILLRLFVAVWRHVRAQCGGVLGLRDILGMPESTSGVDIAQLVDTALARHGDIANFPYSEIMRAIVHYEPRKRRGDK